MAFREVSERGANPATAKGPFCSVGSGHEVGFKEVILRRWQDDDGRGFEEGPIAVRTVPIEQAWHSEEMRAALEACAKALDAAFNSAVDGDIFGVHHNAACDAYDAARAALAKASKVWP